MLQGDGAVNAFLRRIGLGWLRNDWLSDPELAIWTLMAILTWKYIGFAVILFLAGLQGIPEELTEAAAIDGASYWQIQRRITLPLLGPTIRIWAFLSMIGALQLFDLVYIIWGQYVASTAGTSTMATYMVANGRNAGKYGYGNAVAVVLFLISLTAALVYQRFVLRRDTEGAITGGRQLMATTAMARRASAPARAGRETARGGARRLLRRAAAHRGDAGTGPLHHPRRLPHELADHHRPGGLAEPVGCRQLPRCAGGEAFWREVANSTIVAGSHHGRRGRPRPHDELHPCRYRFRGAGRCTRCSPPV